ncbi:MAG: tRNA threonylcarbamoyladenosine dehydratase [Acetivibrio sp.]
MLNQFSRSALLIGEEGVQALNKAKVAVFGIGGVGGFTVEALARSGIGTFDLIDSDEISLTNINRQIIATHKTLGRLKVEVMGERILEINPEAVVHRHPKFFLPENAEEFNFKEYDYIIDAMDTVTAKIELIIQADHYKVPIISSMGTGNKMDPTGFLVTDLYKTKVCPLAKVMRRELRKRNIMELKVVYSEEEPRSSGDSQEDKGSRRSIPGSIAFVPSVAGLIMAGEVIKDLLLKDK